MSTTDAKETVPLTESDRWNGTLDGHCPECGCRVTITAEGCTFPITLTLGESVVDRFCLCSAGTIPLRVVGITLAPFKAALPYTDDEDDE